MVEFTGAFPESSDVALFFLQEFNNKVNIIADDTNEVKCFTRILNSLTLLNNSTSFHQFDPFAPVLVTTFECFVLIDMVVKLIRKFDVIIFDWIPAGRLPLLRT